LTQNKEEKMKMPSQSSIQKMNKLLDNRKFRMKDSDRDGVPDMLDCRPNNPKKQGIIHGIGSKIKAKVENIRQENKERVAEFNVRKEMAHQAAGEEREKQSVRTAVYREQIRGEKARASAKSGGFLGSVLRLTAPQKKAPVRRRVTKTKVKPIVTKRKKKKLKIKVRKMTTRKKKRTSRPSTQRTSSPPRIFDTSSFKY